MVASSHTARTDAEKMIMRGSHLPAIPRLDLEADMPQNLAWAAFAALENTLT